MARSIRILKRGKLEINNMVHQRDTFQTGDFIEMAGLDQYMHSLAFVNPFHQMFPI
jgi:hypothetical protein